MQLKSDSILAGVRPGSSAAQRRNDLTNAAFSELIMAAGRGTMPAEMMLSLFSCEWSASAARRFAADCFVRPQWSCTSMFATLAALI